jgi:probable rRNA maturation factor
MSIEIENMAPAFRVPRASLIKTIRRVLDGEEQAAARVTVILTDDAEIRRLNRTYRHLDRATDVLSFPVDEGDHPDLLGDIYISIDRARDQAARYQVSLTEELRRLVVHGLLHLFGYDHHNAPDRQRMRHRESVYLRDAEPAAPSKIKNTSGYA